MFISQKYIRFCIIFLICTLVASSYANPGKSDPWHALTPEILIHLQQLPDWMKWHPKFTVLPQPLSSMTNFSSPLSNFPDVINNLDTYLAERGYPPIHYRDEPESHDEFFDRCGLDKNSVSRLPYGHISCIYKTDNQSHPLLSHNSVKL